MKYIHPDPPFKDVVDMIGRNLTDPVYRRHLDGYNFVKPTKYDVQSEDDITTLNNFNHTVTYSINKGSVYCASIWIQDNGWQNLHYSEAVTALLARTDRVDDVRARLVGYSESKDQDAWKSLTVVKDGKYTSYNFDEHGVIYSVTISNREIK